MKIQNILSGINGTWCITFSRNNLTNSQTTRAQHTYAHTILEDISSQHLTSSFRIFQISDDTLLPSNVHYLNRIIELLASIVKWFRNKYEVSENKVIGSSKSKFQFQLTHKSSDHIKRCHFHFTLLVLGHCVLFFYL